MKFVFQIDFCLLSQAKRKENKHIKSIFGYTIITIVTLNRSMSQTKSVVTKNKF